MSESQLQWAAGTVATPVANAAYAVHDLTPVAEFQDSIDGSAHLGSMQRGHRRKGKRYTGVSFASRLRGSHVSDGTAPEGALLRACGYSENSGGTGSGNLAYTYKMAKHGLLTDATAGALDPIDLVHNFGRLSRTLKDCVGNVDFEFIAGEFALAHFTFNGNVNTGVATDVLSSAAEAALIAQTDGSAAYPWQNSGTTVNIAAGGAISDLVIPKMRVNTGNKVVAQPSGNGTFGLDAYRLAGRAPTAIATIRAGLLATINLEAAAAAESLIEIKGSINDGGGTRQQIDYGWRGYIVGMSAPEEIDGLMYYTIEMDMSEASGDEFYIGWLSSPAYSYPF